MKKNYVKRIGIIACLSFLLCGSYFTSTFNKQVINSVKAIDDEPTSISASTEYKYSVGDNIYKEHITVTDNLGNEITDFVFNNNGYQFQYEDAAGGGEYTDKVFEDSITYNEMVCSLTVQVKRIEPYSIINYKEEITADDLPATGTSFVSFNNVTKGSGFVYAGSSAKIDWKYIQFQTWYKDRCIVTTGSGGYIKSISITIGKQGTTDVFVYVNETAYTASNNLHYADTQGDLVLSTRSDKTVRVSGNYRYFGVRPNNGAVYIAKITVEYGNQDTAFNLSNYIMFEDTKGQCEDVGEEKGKFSLSADRFLNELSKDERYVFMNSDSYIISKARERFIDWAKHLNKTIEYEDGDYVIKANPLSNNLLTLNKTSSSLIIITIISSSIVLLAITIYLFNYKKKKINR